MRTIGWGLCVVLFALLMVGSAIAQAAAPGAGIYVADNRNNRIVRIDDMTGAGWTTLGGPITGPGTNQFNEPMVVFVDTAGRIYVADGENSRIVRVNDMTGADWTTLGTRGCGVNQFGFPNGVFVDGVGRIYVTDAVCRVIVRVDDMTGAGWTTFGRRLGGTNWFSHPNGIFVDDAGRIYVTDSRPTGGPEFIVRVNGMTGANWTPFGSSGSGPRQFSRPVGIFVDRAGRIYVADANNARIVRVNDMTGAGWTTLGSRDSRGSGVNQFGTPLHVFIDTTGKIYVADGLNNRIVRMDDMSGARWTTFGMEGSGKGQFKSLRGIFVR